MKIYFVGIYGAMLLAGVSTGLCGMTMTRTTHKIPKFSIALQHSNRTSSLLLASSKIDRNVTFNKRFVHDAQTVHKQLDCSEEFILKGDQTQGLFSGLATREPIKKEKQLLSFNAPIRASSALKELGSSRFVKEVQAIDEYDRDYMQVVQDEREQTIARQERAMAELQEQLAMVKQEALEYKQREFELAFSLAKERFKKEMSCDLREQEDPLFAAGVLSFQRGQDQLIASYTQPVKTGVEGEEVISGNFDNYTVYSKTFKPSNQESKILFVCVHGTFSNDDSFGANDLKLTTRALEESARKMAMGHECAVELLSFRWSGRLKLADRAEAAQVLASYMNKRLLHEDNILRIVLFAHSHGCNVAVAAADRMKRPIDIAFLAASPACDISFETKAFNEAFEYQKEVFNIGTIVHCYGSNDVTQIAGSLQSNASLDRKMPLRINDSRKVYNINLMADGNQLNHINIKYHLARHMHELLFCIKTQYPRYYDLIANVFDTDEKPLLAVRHTQFSDTPELFLSAQAEKIFKERYNTAMQQKDSAATRIFTAMRDELSAKGAGL